MRSATAAARSRADSRATAPWRARTGHRAPGGSRLGRGTLRRRAAIRPGTQQKHGAALRGTAAAILVLLVVGGRTPACPEAVQPSAHSESHRARTLCMHANLQCPSSACLCAQMPSS